MRQRILLVLLFISALYATDITVGPSGRDYTTIQNALDACTGGGSFDIYVDAGTYTETENNYLIFDTTNSNCTITLQPATDEDIVTLATPSTAYGLYFYSNLDSANITVNNIRIVPATYATRAVIYKPTNSTVTLNRCTIINKSESQVLFGFDEDFTAADSSTLIIKHCLFNTSGNAINLVDYASRSGGSVLIEHNIIQIERATSAGYGICMGSEVSTSTVDLGSITVRYNYITFVGAAINHGILAGIGADGCQIYGNKIYIGNPGASIKADEVVFCNNTVVATSSPSGQYPVTLKDADNCYFSGNTLIGGGVYSPLIIQNNGDGYDTLHCHIFDNVLYSLNSTAIQIEDGNTDNFINYNAYYTMATNVYNLDGTMVAQSGGIIAVQEAWATYAEPYKNNDSHSIIANPSIDANYHALNFGLKNTGSPLLINSDGTVLLRNDIGATKFSTESSRALLGGIGLIK